MDSTAFSVKECIHEIIVQGCAYCHIEYRKLLSEEKLKTCLTKCKARYITALTELGLLDFLQI